MTRIRAIFDNKGETFDRYTVIFNDGEMIGLSENPNTSQGFNQYCGNVVDDYMFHSWGAGWRRHLDVNKITRSVLREQIRLFEYEGNIGVRTQLSRLPEEVKTAIKNRQHEN